MSKRLAFAIVCAGFIAMAGQIVFLRELLVVFSGNELSIGLTLAAWLFAGGAGAFLFAARPGALKAAVALPLLQTLAGLYIPLGVFFCGMVRSWLGLVPGQIVSFPALALASLVIVLPFCAVMGYLFGLFCREAGQTGTVYALEAIGSILGGLAAGLLMTRYFSGLESAGMLAAAGCLSAAVLLYRRSGRVFVLPLIIALPLVLSVPAGSWKQLERFSLAGQWPGYSPVFTADSIYGTTAVLKREGQITFMHNGTRVASSNEQGSSEEAVHFALLPHPDPAEVLLIGGGPAGLVGEILKHPVKRLDYLELDPVLVRAARQYLPAAAAAFDDPRVSVKNIDGRAYVRNTGRSYDCVILFLGEPYTAQVNRFYTLEFFLSLKRILKEGGIVSFGLSASESYLNRWTRDFLGCVHATLKKSFGQVAVIPGETAVFLAGGGSGGISLSPISFNDRSRQRGIELAYVRDYYLAARMSPSRIDWLKGELEKSAGKDVNLDFHPLGYHYGLGSWSSRFQKPFPLLTPRVLLPWLAAMLAGVLIFGLINRRSGRALIAAGVMGFSAAGLQIALLFVFQVAYGYLFYQMGVLFACFMAGLALGAWWAGRRKIGDPAGAVRTFLWLNAAFCLLLPLVLARLSGNGGIPEWLGANMVFPGLALLIGTLSGIQFSLANLLFERSVCGKRAAGMVYGADLFGSCLGSTLMGVSLIPVLGVACSCLFAGLLNVAAGLVFISRR